jgi:hypothetical protein
MRTPRLLVSIGLGVGLLASSASAIGAEPTATPAPAPAPVVEAQAVEALKRMGAYLATLNSFEVQTQTSLDIVTNDSQRIQLDGGAAYKVRRPDGFVIDVVLDTKKRRFVYDGKQFTVYSPELGYYATVDAPPTIGQTLDAIDQKFGIELPLEDLFRWNDPANGRINQLRSGFVVGTATIDGVQTDHYAFREMDVDWQIWIDKGDRPLPRKLMIVDAKDPVHPAYVARLTWNVNPNLTADTFAFRPDKAAKPIRLSQIDK